RRDAVRGRVRTDLDRAADADGLAGGDAADLHAVEARVRQPLPRPQHVAKALRRLRRHPDPAAAHAMELTLPGVKRDADGVVEMRVRDEDVRHADGRVGAAAEVEHDAEVADA